MQHDAMGQHDRRQLLDVVRKAIIASSDDCQRFGRLAQPQGSSCADPQG
jgi:hypothetical protein